MNNNTFDINDPIDFCSLCITGNKTDISDALLLIKNHSSPAGPTCTPSNIINLLNNGLFNLVYSKRIDLIELFTESGLVNNDNISYFRDQSGNNILQHVCMYVKDHHGAIDSDNVAFIRWLYETFTFNLTDRNENGSTIFHLLCTSSALTHENIILLLNLFITDSISNGINPFTLEDSLGNTMFLQACTYQPKVALFLLEKYQNYFDINRVNIYGENAIFALFFVRHIIVHDPEKSVFDNILRKFRNPSEPTIYVSYPCYSIELNEHKVVLLRKLVQAGININLKDNAGDNILKKLVKYCTRVQDVQSIRLLLENTTEIFDINQQDNDGKTILHYLVHPGRPYVVDVFDELLNYILDRTNINRFIPDNQNSSAMDYFNRFYQWQSNDMDKIARIRTKLQNISIPQH